VLENRFVTVYRAASPIEVVLFQQRESANISQGPFLSEESRQIRIIRERAEPQASGSTSAC
jgi:hypothetical protein